LQPSNNTAVSVETGGAVFPKTARLRKRSEFLRLSNAQHKTSVKGFLVVWSENSGMSARMGITASKKIGCAVVRNRVKRYLREVFRHDRMLLPPVDVNIIARRESALMDCSDVRREITKAFRLIGTSTCSRASCSL
jgi:ribonuclease P protein component